MKLALSSDIKKIDRLVPLEFGISEAELVRRSGEAVARAVRESIKEGSRVAVIVGSGNNGADGYAAAELLLLDYSVAVYEITPEKEKSDACRMMREAFVSKGGTVIQYSGTEDGAREICKCDCIVDAVFGTGFRGALPEKIATLSKILLKSHAVKIAVDLPLGVCADNANVEKNALRVDKTVALAYPKLAHYSYPSAEYVGEVILERIGLPTLEIEKKLEFTAEYIDAAFAKKLLPERPKNSNKGTYGRLLVITGSEKYRGAAYLSLSGALRSGVGLVTYLGDESLCRELLPTFPEVVYQRTEIGEDGRIDTSRLVELSRRHTAALIGCGSDKTESTFDLLRALLLTEGSPVVIDADAINLLANDEGRALLKNKKRKVVLTPHPLELARLSNKEVGEVSADRIGAAREIALEYGVTVLLKGAGTVITDGERVYINGSGSPALSKGGSGDVLSGVIGSMLAMGLAPLSAAALSAYIHGRAADALSALLSEYGVTPSDLPKAIAIELKSLSDLKE